MNSFLKQPLIHFLLIGLGFFVLFQVVGNNDGSADSKTIVVDKNALLTHLQYRSKAFNEATFEEKLANMPDEELQEMIKEYIREEVLFREARAMGMDQNDYIIKRRMIQKVEFIAQGLSEITTELSEKEIQQYYDENQQDYYVNPYVTFTHVYFNTDNKNLDRVKKKANDELMFLNENNIRFEQAPSRGERFLYHTNYVEREPEYVASHFGVKMAQKIFEAKPSNQQWIGPFESEYGFHLVLLTKKVEGRIPELPEIRDRVIDDAERFFIRQKNEETIQEIIDEYDVEVVYREDETKTNVKAEAEEN